MRTELRSWRRAWPRVGKATVDVEVEAEVVEEEEEDAEEEKEEEGGGGRRRRRTTLIKSNNPHLAGGEKHGLMIYPTLRVETQQLIFSAEFTQDP